MRQHHHGDDTTGGASGEAMLSNVHAFETALRVSRDGAGEAGSLQQPDQIARDLADIERAIAALRKAEPALETWNETPADNLSQDPAMPAMRKPRPVWPLIGFLWLSTALVIVGALAAIRVLTG